MLDGTPAGLAIVPAHPMLIVYGLFVTITTSWEWSRPDR
jgi:hypothetical protein